MSLFDGWALECEVKHRRDVVLRAPRWMKREGGSASKHWKLRSFTSEVQSPHSLQLLSNLTLAEVIRQDHAIPLPGRRNSLELSDRLLWNGAQETATVLAMQLQNSDMRLSTKRPNYVLQIPHTSLKAIYFHTLTDEKQGCEKKRDVVSANMNSDSAGRWCCADIWLLINIF